MTFNPKVDLKCLQIEHVTSLNLVLDLRNHEYQEMHMTTLTNGFELIRNNMCNLKKIYIKFVSCYTHTQEVIEPFRKNFCQMLKSLAKTLQRVQIKVKKLYYINTLLPNLDELTDLYVMDTELDDFQRFLSLYPAKLCLQFKNLRTFYIDVNVSLYWYQLEDDWIKLRLPQVIDEMFQGITDVKIQFNRVMGCFK